MECRVSLILGLAVGGRLAAGEEGTVLALVTGRQPGETLTLKLPDGLALAPEQQATQAVPQARAGARNPMALVTWRIRPARAGRFEVEVQSSANHTVKRSLLIAPAGAAP